MEKRKEIRMETKTGSIITMKKENGYGFIKPDTEKEKNIFFHASGVLNPRFDELKVNERVEYLEEVGRIGMRAIDIAVI